MPEQRRPHTAGDAAPRPLKIGLLTHSVNPRGGVVHTLELATALHRQGHDVTVFAPASPGQTLFRALPCRVRLVPVAAGPRSTVEMVASRIAAFTEHLDDLLRQEHLDVLHAQDPIGANALADLQAQGRIEGFVRTVHHLDSFENAQLAQWQLRGMQAAQQVLCVSRLWCELLQREHGISAHEVRNGVDLQRYQRQADAHDVTLKARWGLRGGADAPVLLSVGGIEARKNTVRILQAFAQLRQALPRAQLVIAGGASLLNHDTYTREFQAQASALGLHSTPGADLVLTGPLPDAQMPALFRCADALVMPSLREGFGLVVLEALASGTPVVISRIAPYTEYLGDSDGCWADPHDPASITAAMQAALAPHWLQQLRQTPDVCRRYSWDRSAAEHADLYRAHAHALRPTLVH